MVPPLAPKWSAQEGGRGDGTEGVEQQAVLLGEGVEEGGGDDGHVAGGGDDGVLGLDVAAGVGELRDVALEGELLGGGRSAAGGVGDLVDADVEVESGPALVGVQRDAGSVEGGLGAVGERAFGARPDRRP